MSLSVYSKDIRNINDNIDIINDKQRKINDTITMIESSINKIKNNCFGSTASVICIRLNNLKSELLNTNSDLSTYKQQSQIVVDNFNQGCLGLDLDEVVLKNNLNLLNDKLEIYQSLSLPNNALVDNTNEMINRNQDLLYRLNNFETNTYDKLVLNTASSTQNTGSSTQSNFPEIPDEIDHIWNLISSAKSNLFEVLAKLCSDVDADTIKAMKRFDNFTFFPVDIMLNIPHALNYDWNGNPIGSTINFGFDLGIDWGFEAGGAAIGAKAGVFVGRLGGPAGVIIGGGIEACLGAIAGGFVGDYILEQEIPDCVPGIGGKTVDEVIDDVGYAIGDWIGGWFD